MAQQDVWMKKNEAYTEKHPPLAAKQGGGSVMHCLFFLPLSLQRVEDNMDSIKYQEIWGEILRCQGHWTFPQDINPKHTTE